MQRKISRILANLLLTCVSLAAILPWFLGGGSGAAPVGRQAGQAVPAVKAA